MNMSLGIKIIIVHVNKIIIISYFCSFNSKHFELWKHVCYFNLKLMVHHSHVLLKTDWLGKMQYANVLIICHKNWKKWEQN